MTFETYYQAVVDAVFPEGEAENLGMRHRNAVVDGLIDLQRKVKCLREGHCDVTKAEDAFDVCNASVVARTPGTLQKVLITLFDNACTFFRPEYLPPDVFDVYVRDNSACIGLAYTALDEGVTPSPPARTSSPCESAAVLRPVLPAGTRYVGYYTFDMDSVRVFPPLVEGEALVQQWNGLKYDWQNGDDMGSRFAVRDVVKAVELFMETDAQRFEAKDSKQAGGALALYNVQVADLIYTCRRNAFPVPGLELPRSPGAGGSGTPVLASTIYSGKQAGANASSEAEIALLAQTQSTHRGVRLEFPTSPGVEFVYISMPASLGLGNAPSGFVIADGFNTPMAMGEPGSADPFGTFTLNGYWFDEIVLHGKAYRVFRTALPYLADLAIQVQ